MGLEAAAGERVADWLMAHRDGPVSVIGGNVRLITTDPVTGVETKDVGIVRDVRREGSRVVVDVVMESPPDGSRTLKLTVDKALGRGKPIFSSRRKLMVWSDDTMKVEILATSD